MPVMNLIMFIVFSLASLAFFGLISVGTFTYIRRNWRIMRSEDDESMQSKMLDGIQQISMQLSMQNERLDRLEKQLLANEDRPLLPLDQDNDQGE